MDDPASIRPQTARGRVSIRLIPITLAEFACLLALSLSLSGLIEGAGWWFAVVFAGTSMLTVGVLARSVRIHPSVVPVIQAVVLMLGVTAVFARETAILGFVPALRTWSLFAALTSEALNDVRDDTIPAPAAPALLFVVVVAGALLLIVLDAVAVGLRRPVPAGGVFVAALAVPASVTGSDLWPTVLCAVAYFWLIRASQRAFRGDSPRPGATFAVATGAIVVALAVSAVVPVPAISDGIASGLGVRAPGTVTVSPLVELGKDLREPKPVDVLDYTSTSPQPPYLKLLTLNDFNGRDWTRSGTPVRSLTATGRVGRATGLSPSVHVQRVETDVHIDGLVSHFLPAPSVVTDVRGVSGSWSWSPSDLTIGSSGSTSRGQSYIVDSMEIEPTVRQLDSAGGPAPASLRAELALPADVPAVITQTAERATAGDTDQYQEALDLQDFFRENGFDYSTSTPLKQGYDGAGLQVVAKFLTVKAGYCVHFASAMAIMARILGIPAEIDVGYVPGDLVGRAAHGRYEFRVDSSDLHAWPVLYLRGLGWVSFEPTVGTATVPAYSAPSAKGIAQPGSSRSSSGATGSEAQKGRLKTSQGPEAPRGAEELKPGTTVLTEAASIAGVLVWAIALAASAAAASIIVVDVRRAVRRRRRLNVGREGPRRSQTLTGPPSHAENAWEEVRDSAIDLGWRSPATETPRVFASRLAAALGGTVEEIDVLVAAVERDRFGPAAANVRVEVRPETPCAAVARAVIRELTATAPVGRRILARTFPRSEWRRVRARVRRRLIILAA